MDEIFATLEFFGHFKFNSTVVAGRERFDRFSRPRQHVVSVSRDLVFPTLSVFIDQSARLKQLSFSGDLKHVPLVDVIQLLHNTRSSGILHLNGRRGECQLVFKGGYIVSGGHIDPAMRIGEILISRKVINSASLKKALQAQSAGGQSRKPLIVTMIDLGLVKEEDAYKGLKYLIEMVIVEILTWNQGTFRLEASDEVAKDGFQYYPDNIEHEVSVDIQAVLMDALRIFDEKMRDGELTMEGDAEDGPEKAVEPEPVTEEDLPEVDVLPVEEPEPPKKEKGGLTADLLGLDELDKDVPKPKKKPEKDDGITADDLGLDDLDDF